MEIERIRELTSSALNHPAPGILRFEVIEKGGSGRIFLRVSDPGSSRTWVAMVYSDDRPDNARFGSITDFLLAHGVSVPAIVGRNEGEGFLLLQDLGNADLGDSLGGGWEEEVGPRYREALETVFQLHEIREGACPADLPELEFCFDAELYQWEQDYFFNHYVTNFEPGGALGRRGDRAFSELRDWLGGLPRALVHRDFQSTNVMFSGGRCYLIDYQGMRFGLPEYDLASLVYDPYVDLTERQREELIAFYFSLKVGAGHSETEAAFRQRFYGCVIQRLMQALGAYGFLGLRKGKKEFLRHIRPAKERLRLVAEKEFPVLLEVLAT